MKNENFENENSLKHEETNPEFDNNFGTNNLMNDSNQLNNKKNNGLIIVLLIIILGLIGYIVYDKVIEKSNNNLNNDQENKENENKQEENKQDEYELDPSKIKDGEYLLEKNFSIKFNGNDLKITHKLYYSDADFNFDYDVFINDKKITKDAVWVSASKEDYPEIKKQFLATEPTIKVFKNENKEYLYVSHYSLTTLKILDADLNLLGSVELAAGFDFPSMSKNCKNYSRYNSANGDFTTIVFSDDAIYYLDGEKKKNEIIEHKVTIKDNKLVDEVIDTCLAEN